MEPIPRTTAETTTAPRLVPVSEQHGVQARRHAEAFADRQLVEQTLAGDTRAFAALVDRYGQPITSLCYASTLDRAEAEDLTQEIFLSAWRKLASFRGEAAFSTWLFALARNACIDRSRRKGARPQQQLAIAASEEVTAADDPDSATVAAILALARTLSEPLRQALLLRDIQGLSYDEIATIQGVPVGTVRSRIASARLAIVAGLEP
jgi:RNA polymerase sigma-70 factor (ECF subfamily)